MVGGQFFSSASPSLSHVSCVVFVPVDVIKERLQIQTALPTHSVPAVGTAYRGSWDALVTIARQEGVRGVYRGYWATLLSFGPFSAAYFALYEKVGVHCLSRCIPYDVRAGKGEGTVDVWSRPRGPREFFSLAVVVSGCLTSP